jgi:nondiscriminating aspartyl-tRNA synthetase
MQKEELVVKTGYLHTIRIGKKNTFIILRIRHSTIQVVIETEKIKDIISDLTLESIITVEGEMKYLEEGTIKSCTITNAEIYGNNIKVVSKNEYELPMQINNVDKIRPHIDTILNNRNLSLRTLENQSIFQVQSLICKYFRDFFGEKDFIEIHTPKIISGASESGAHVFALDYFGEKRFLAQSPQLYKQAMINAGYKKVFEIGSVFRAEKSTGPRHLTEFMGLDIEMEFKEDYHEVINMLYNFLKYLFDKLQNENQELLKNVESYKKIEYPDEPLIFEYYEIIKKMEEEGYKFQNRDDINTIDEKQIGTYVKEKYNSDIVILTKYPKDARPFYSMISEDDNNLTNSYDIILCGNEILSGAQRVNDYKMLIENAKNKGINIESLEEYINTFKHGSPKHGGGGFGLERITMFFLGLSNIKLATLYPNYYN